MTPPSSTKKKPFSANTARNHRCRIVLTGGPGGGKTTAVDLFRREIGEEVVVVPEAATLMFTGGFPRYQNKASIYSSQRAIYHVQRNLEDTHMTNAAKLEKLFALVTLAFLFSFAWGCYLRATRKLTKAVARKSLFRQGLESILRLLSNPHLKAAERKEFITWLKSPFHSSIFVV